MEIGTGGMQVVQVVLVVAPLVGVMVAWAAATQARRSAVASERLAAATIRPIVMPSGRPGSPSGEVAELSIQPDPTGYTVSCGLANHGPGGALLVDAEAVADNGQPAMSAEFGAPILAPNMATEVRFHWERPTGVERAFEQPTPCFEENAVREFRLVITVTDLSETSRYMTSARFQRRVPPMDRAAVCATEVHLDFNSRRTSRLAAIRTRLLAFRTGQ